MNPITVALLLFFQQQPPPSSPGVHLPTSEAIDLARKLARDLGYPIDRYPKYVFDVTMSQNGKPLYTGYVSIGFYGNGQPISHFDINEQTGQILDGLTCKVFDFPNLKAFQKRQQQMSGSTPRTNEEMMDEIGCDKLTVVQKPVVPNAQSKPSKK